MRFDNIKMHGVTVKKRFALFHGCRVFVSYIISYLRTPSANYTYTFAHMKHKFFKDQWQLGVINSLALRNFTTHKDNVGTEVQETYFVSHV
jgi:hypothetical protein